MSAALEGGKTHRIWAVGGGMSNGAGVHQIGPAAHQKWPGHIESGWGASRGAGKCQNWPGHVRCGWGTLNRVGHIQGGLSMLVGWLGGPSHRGGVHPDRVRPVRQGLDGMGPFGGAVAPGMGWGT